MTPEFPDLKQQNLELQQKKEGKLQTIANSIYALSIMINNKEQHQITQIKDSLSLLLDNMFNILETPSMRFTIQPQLALKNLQFSKTDRISLYSKNPSFNPFFKSENSQSLFEQIKEAQQLQMKQILGNILIFDIQNEKRKYNDCFIAACQMNEKSNKKIIFINLTGVDHCDETLQYEFQEKLNYCYLNFKEFQYLKQYNKLNCDQLYEKKFLNIYFNYGESKIFSWDQFKLIYRLHIKKLIKRISSNIFILSIAKSLSAIPSKEFIQFDDDCLRRVIQKFCKLGQEKLFIHLVLLDSESGFPIELKQLTNGQNQDLVRFINCIFQGVIGKKIKSKVDFDLDTYRYQNPIKYINWLQEFVKIQIQVKLDPIFLNMYKRELRNLFMSNTQIQSEEFLQESTLMILNKNEIYRKTHLYYEQKKLQFLFNSILLVDYDTELVVILKQDESEKDLYYLYYTQIYEDQNELQCQRILLNKYVDDVLLIDSHNRASLSVKKMIQDKDQHQKDYKIVYIHSLNSDIILETQLLDNPIVRIIERMMKKQNYVEAQNLAKQKSIISDQYQISNLLKNRRGPCVVQNSPISETDFMVIGGELSNDRSICNVMEIVKVEQLASLGFHSYILQKEVLFAQGSFFPWPYMFVLSSNHNPQIQYIFLPGDYNNLINCYSRPIVNVYQYYAYQLTTQKDSFYFRWQKLNIIYDNSNLGSSQPFPIQYLSGNQSNILCKEDSNMTKWIIAKTINKQILLGSKGKTEFFKCMENLDSNVSLKDIEQIIITAEIYVQESNLIVKEKYYETNKQLILKKNIVDLNREDLIIFEKPKEN
ncbi:unnamed protein product [Paramecium octaurelia]|uniref:Uncharacterized protein n=1 Tax=Paramecium octaurelia TaxID=43137 RepID=A0A8S1SS32_PAROT|nr:unnamed protein product [Paramecium octaurelia]